MAAFCLGGLRLDKVTQKVTTGGKGVRWAARPNRAQGSDCGEFCAGCDAGKISSATVEMVYLRHLHDNKGGGGEQRWKV